MSKALSTAVKGVAVATATEVFSHGLKEILTYVGNSVTSGFKTAWNKLMSFIRKPNAPNIFMVGDPRVKDDMSYREKLIRTRKCDYTVNYHMRYEKQVITAMSVLPLSETMQCPEVDVLDGGINKRHVKLRLTPVVDEQWGCDVIICGSPDPQ